MFLLDQRRRKRPAARSLQDPRAEVAQALLESLRQPRPMPPAPAPPREYTAVEHYLLSLAPALERLPFLDLEIVKNKINKVILDNLQNLTHY